MGSTQRIPFSIKYLQELASAVTTRLATVTEHDQKKRKISGHDKLCRNEELSYFLYRHFPLDKQTVSAIDDDVLKLDIRR